MLVVLCARAGASSVGTLDSELQLGLGSAALVIRAGAGAEASDVGTLGSELQLG